MAETTTFSVPPGYDSRFDHFVNFMDAIREGKKVFEDATYGFRAAAPSLLSNVSYMQKAICKWDPETMKMHS